MRRWKRQKVSRQAFLYVAAILIALQTLVSVRKFAGHDIDSVPSTLRAGGWVTREDHIKAIERRVISFSLFGNDSRYTSGALRNLALAAIHFPGWRIYFYVDNSVPSDVLIQLETNISEVKVVDKAMQGIPGAYWRFLTADEPSVDRYIIRDVDSRLNARDQMAVGEWIQSYEPFHVMRDHPAHCGWPVNAGMWGGVKGALQGMRQLIDEWIEQDGKETRYDQDQRFLRDVIWQTMSQRHIAHDSHCCLQFPHCRPFPTQRPSNFQHVGQVFFGDDTSRQGDIDMLAAAKAPDACRLHAEWEYG